MSEPVPPRQRITPISRDPVDTRDINMNRLEPNPANPANPASPFPDVLKTSDGRTLIRQPDGSYAFTADPPPPAGLQPAATPAATSPLAGHGFMAILATLATVAIIAVGVNMASGGDKTGEAPPAYTAPASTTLTTIPESPSPTVLIDTGSARANQIVTDIVKGCLSSNANMELKFEAVPGVDLEQVFQAIPDHPDPVFDVGTVMAADLFTVTITSLGPNNLGAKGRWAVDIKSGGVVPLHPITGSSGGWNMYNVLMGRGCGTIQEML
jgi:hypothetical protein